ncbi:MAG: T9SS type A sorting domain-containing protein [Bacteroidia bacterium]|nr:T9SS type A sorting domain-containing protein [Bacteroidia bacterium]
MKKFVFVFALLFHSAISFSNYWHPYPINVVIGTNGTQQRLELSVWDSVLGSWQYYNTPFYNSSIDTTFSSSEIVALKTYFPPNLYDRDSIYGFITYDPVLHLFRPYLSSNPDPDVPGASVYVYDNVVEIIVECCEFYDPWNGSYYDISAQAYIYDINLHAWQGGELESGYGADKASVSLNLGIASYITFEYNNQNWNPREGVFFYTPSIGQFKGVGFSDAVNGMSGNQDLLYCQYQQFINNNISANCVYSPHSGTFYGFVRSSPGIDLLNGGMTYQSYPDSNLSYITVFDDFSGEMKIDSIDHPITKVKIKNRVAAYVDTTVSPSVVHYQVFSPTLYDWVKDSSLSTNGVSTLNIIDGTVHWTDSIGNQYKAGYNDTLGWGAFDTPLQLMFQVTDLFPTMGVPLIFVRDYSIGTDSARFHFGDGYSTTYSQGSAWHQYKINGSYGSTANDTFNICMETFTGSGIQTACRAHSFTTPLQGGIAAATTNIICSGDSVLLNLSGHNGPINWQKLVSSGWVNLTGPGANLDSVTVHPSEETFYRAKIANGTDAPAYSNILRVYVIPSVIPGFVSGLTTVCKYEQVQYSVDSIPGVLSYIWNLPSGWTGSSTYSSIVVVPNSNGTISVSANTVCGTTSPLTVNLYVESIDTSLIFDNPWLSPINWVDSTSYYWFDCTTGATVGNGFYFEPSQSGSYACVFQYNGCTDTSSCWQIILSGVESLNSNGNISVSPNPTNRNIKIKGNEMTPGFYKIKLSDVYGQLVTEQDYVCTGKNMETEINLSEFSSGIFFLHIGSKSGSRVLKVVKE